MSSFSHQFPTKFVYFLIGSDVKQKNFNFIKQQDFSATQSTRNSIFLFRDSVLAMYSATFLAWIAGLKASAMLHTQLLSHVFHNPMSFFDVTPSGRVLARFSNDVNTIDDRLINNIRQCLMTSLRVRVS